jgi:hypothetical protein
VKKYLITILVLLSMLVVQVGVVAAAPLAAGTATLVSVQYVPGKGPVFTFNVTGEFSRSELKGTLHVEGGAHYALHCTQVDDTTVKCSTSAQVSGVNVSFTWGGSTFWTNVPEAPVFCYGIYDWNYPVEDAWQLYGTHCQDTRADYGDFFFWDNPDYGSSPYVFLPESLVCPFYQPGDGYYFPGCPGLPE